VGVAAQGADLTGLLNQLPLEVAPPAERAQLDNEHVFDALVAALTARAVVVGATDPEDVPGLVELEVAVPRSAPALR